MRLFFVLAALLSAALVSRAQTPDAAAPSSNASLLTQGMFPFVLPALDDSPTAFDLSSLNSKPAGARGFVSVAGEHFVDGDGRLLRLWGVNLNFEGVFPPKELAPRIAGRLAKFGFNAVRLHHFDGNAAPRGIWKAASLGSARLLMPRAVDPDQLDRLDFFVDQLLQHGIYVDFNLHVARKVTESEGFVNAANLPDKDKGMAALDERIAAQNRDFARFLLLHVNPYSGRAYRDEPGVCALEVDNESSALALWLDGTLNALPQPYAENLRVSWNDWLTRRYFSEASFRRAWTEIDAPLSGPDALNPPLPRTAVTPAPDSSAPTILGQPAGVLSDGTVAPFVPAPAPTAAPEIAAGLDAWKLNTAGGASGSAARDDLGGPSVDGFVQPGLSLNLARAGSVSWAFQLTRDGLTLEDGKPYTLTFWARSSAPRGVGVNLWSDTPPYKWLGFTQNVALTSDWQPFSCVLRASGAEAGHVRLSLNLGSAAGQVQLGAFSLRAGGKISAPSNWSLRNGAPLPDAKNEPIFAVRRDFALFLGELEAKNVRETRAFLRNLGVKVPIWHTQAQFGGWGGVARETLSDAIDTHIYWKHPDLGGTGWGGSWRVGNQSMAASPLGDPLAATAMLRVPGKPFVVSEYNSGQPNDFGAESLPMLAAFAAYQDWAGAWIFDYHSSGDFNRTKIDGFFSIDSHPTKMAMAPLAALLFRRPDIAPAPDEVTLNLPPDALWREVANTPGTVAIAPFLKTWNGVGAPRGVGLTGRAGVSTRPGLFASPSRATADVPGTFGSGALRWDVARGIWSLQSPLSRVVAGWVGGQQIMLGEAQFWVAPGSKWATIGLTTLDNQPVARSKRLLLTLAGRAENLGMKWNADRSSVGNDWGSGPTYVAGITATIKLLTGAPAARVWALDERGVRRGQLDATLKNGALKFAVSPVWRSLWYEIELS